MPYQRIVIERYGPPNVLNVIEEPQLPEPTPGEVRIRLLAASASYTDTMIRKGAYPEVREKPPFSPGYDLVGVVDKLGEGARKFNIGDRVCDLTVILDFLRFRLMALLPGSRRKIFYSITVMTDRHPAWFSQDLTALFDLLSEGKIRPVVWKRLPLSEAKQAHELIEQSAPKGKIILFPPGVEPAGAKEIQ